MGVYRVFEMIKEATIQSTDVAQPNANLAACTNNRNSNLHCREGNKPPY